MILAIDPGLANTGWQTSTGLGGTAVTKSGVPLSTRICKTAHAIKKAVGGTPEIVIVEDTFGNLMKPTTMLLGGLMVAFPTSKFLLVSPGKWIRDLFGPKFSGQYKEQTRLLVEKLGIKYGTQHQADAIGLLEWYKKFGVVVKTKRRKKRRKNASS